MSSHIAAARGVSSSSAISPTRQWLGLVALVLPVLLIAIDNTVLGFAVPSLSRELNPSAGQLLWIVDIYAFLLAGLLITMGSLGDRIGRRRLLLFGSAAFGAASAFAAFSTSAEMLIAARALLGIAGATLMPSTLALLRTLFPEQRQRMLAIAIWASAFSAGAAFGPILGGLLLEHFFWGSIFLINIPVAALVLVAVPLLVPESRNPTPGRFDPLSVLQSITGMLTAVYGLKRLAAGEVSLVPILAFAMGVAILVSFVRRQRRLPEPLLDLSLFSLPRFRTAVMTNFMLVFALVGSMFFLTQLLQLAYGMSPLRASLVLVPGLLASVVASFVVIPLARRYSLRALVATGILIAGAGFALLIGAPESNGYLVAGLAFLALGTGMGLAETLTNSAVLSSAPAHRSGAASAISETAYELGGALGVAILGAVLSAIYRVQLLGTPIEVAEGETLPRGAVPGAAETLAAAEEISSGLGGQVGASIWDAAHSAFVTSVHWTSAVATALMLVAAALVLIMLRGDRAASQAGAISAGEVSQTSAAGATPAPATMER